MAVTVAKLRSFVGATEGDDVLLEDCLTEATLLVDGYVGAPSVPVPGAILERAYLEVGADLFNRRNAPLGILNQQFASTDGVGTSPVRIARDPLAPAYSLLNRWVRPW